MLSVAEVAAVVGWLAPRTVGGQVQKVREPRPGTLVLSVRTPGQTTYLVLCGAPPAPRISEADDAGDTLPEPTHLGRWLRAALKGRRLTGLTALPDERVVVVEFEGGRLVAELTGNTANLYGLNPEGRVMASARRVPGVRDLRPGRPWTPPPPAERRPEGAVRFADARAVEAAAGERTARSDGGGAVQARAALVGRVRKRLEALWAKVANDVGRAEGADAWRRAGELLKGQMQRARRGASSVEVVDWFAPQTGPEPPTVTIELNPALDVGANVERLFARYRKARSGLVKANARLAEVEAQLETLAALDAEHADAEALAEALTRAGLQRAKAGGGGPKAAVAPRRPYRIYLSSQGERILVGRGGADNHATTFHAARGNDWWLHIRDAPGAHVVVPMPKGGEPHPETLRDAAALAARHSDLRDEGVVTVTLTRRKHVRAIPGAAPGRVSVADARSLMVEQPRARADALRRVDQDPAPGG